MTKAEIIHAIEWLWPVRTIKYLYYRLRFIAIYHYDGYGKPGFMRLEYKGVPIVQRDDIPSGKVWVIDLPMDELEQRLFLKKLFGKNKKPVVLEKHNVHNKAGG